MWQTTLPYEVAANIARVATIVLGALLIIHAVNESHLLRIETDCSHVHVLGILAHRAKDIVVLVEVLQRHIHGWHLPGWVRCSHERTLRHHACDTTLVTLILLILIQKCLEVILHRVGTHSKLWGWIPKLVSLIHTVLVNTGHHQMVTSISLKIVRHKLSLHGLKEVAHPRHLGRHIHAHRHRWRYLAHIWRLWCWLLLLGERARAVCRGVYWGGWG